MLLGTDPLDPPPNGTIGTDPLDPQANDSSGGLGIAPGTPGHICRIGRNAPFDGENGVEDAWAAIATDVPCRLLKSRRTVEKLEGGAVRAMTIFDLQLPLGQDIGPADQVDKDSLLYEVTDTDQGSSDTSFLTAYVVRVRAASIDW